MSNTALIYELRDPISKAPRYVGITADRAWNGDGNVALKRRLKSHCYQLRDGTQAKKEWIARIRRQGLRPTIHLLEVVPYDNALASERRWIEYLRNRGEDLVNRRASQSSRSSKQCQPRSQATKMQMIEMANGGAPIEDVLTGLFAELHTIDAVAARLNIHRITLMAWLDNLGAERESYKVTRIRFPERPAASAAT